jgi:hypothetical protein
LYWVGRRNFFFQGAFKMMRKSNAALRAQLVRVGLLVVRTRYRHGNTARMLEKLAIIDLAGTVLEPEPKRCAQDERHAIKRCMRVVADGASPCMTPWPAARRLNEQLRGRALQLVADHLNEIGAVAIALAAKGRLTGAEINGLIAGVDS